MAIRIQEHQTQQQAQKQTLKYQQRMLIGFLAMDRAALKQAMLEEAQRNPCLEINYGGTDEVLAARVEAHSNFRDDLRLQLCAVKDRAVRSAGEFLVECLDSRGYLTDSLQDLHRVSRIPKSVLQQALREVQALEPAGVGAGSVAECYLLQLQRQKHPDSDAILLVQKGFPVLLQDGVQSAQRELGWTPERMSHALNTLQQLSMRPIAQTDDDAPPIRIDARLKPRPEGGYQVELLKEDLPTLQISSSYLEKGSRFANEGLFYARRFLSMLEQRDRTLQQILQYAVDRQTTFLDGGTLERLTRREVAEALNIHPSTVTRVTQDRYLLHKNRPLPTASLFQSGGVSFASSDKLKDVIQELVHTEDPNEPCSDQQIADMLHHDYLVDISRRTVAKYRQQLGIAPARERKKL